MFLHVNKYTMVTPLMEKAPTTTSIYGSGTVPPECKGSKMKNKWDMAQATGVHAKLMSSNVLSLDSDDFENTLSQVKWGSVFSTNRSKHPLMPDQSKNTKICASHGATNTVDTPSITDHIKSNISGHQPIKSSLLAKAPVISPSLVGLGLSW